MVTGLAASLGISAEGSEAILHRADEARGNLKGVTWTVTVESVRGEKTSEISFEVKARGFDVFANTQLPARHKGDKLLMLHGNMWFHKLGLSKPIPISRRQKLLGNAAYGDIAATDYAEEYESVVIREEAVDGEPCHVFDLKSRDKKATYDRILYWIAKDRQVGVKAEYFTVSGKRFKSARMTYASRLKINGVDRPFISEIVIYDELMSRDTTTLRFSSPGFEALPDYLFNLNFMGR
jgi:hypothetical protein